MLKDEILANEDETLNLVKNRWDIGKRPNGSIIGTYRSAEYASFKYAINPSAGGDVDLTVTRALRNGLEIFPMGNSNFNIFSRDKKAVSIAEKYGVDVYGLTEKEEDKTLLDAKQEIYKELFNFVFK